MSDHFFIGWSSHSFRLLRSRFALAAALLLATAAVLGLALGAGIGDPGGGAPGSDGTVTGVIIAEPYPLLIADPDAAHPLGHAMLLAGGGKIGVQDQATPLDGRRVRIGGLVMKRGTLDMLLVASMQPADGDATMPARASLGRWRLTGEICDGKCYAGVMRPGAGLSHKACANVCLLSGIPPVLVTTAPVAGSEFLLIADATGHALPDALRDHVAILQRMDGEVMRVADLLIFRTDIAAAREP